MFWVIARCVCKSGNNNIAWRIGRFNKFSSRKCQISKKISEQFLKSKKNKIFQEKIKQNRESNTLYKTYEYMEDYIYTKLKYNRGDSRANLWGSKGIYYDMWGKIYAHEILRIIADNKKQNWKRWPSYLKLSPIHKKDIKAKIFAIIYSNNKYNSLNSIMKFWASRSLYDFVIIASSIKSKWWWSNYGEDIERSDEG